PASRPYIEGGKIRALGVTSTKRLDWLPNVPTLGESGVAGMEVMASWTGMFAPAKTPPAVIARLHDQLAKAMTQPVRDRLTALGVIPVGNSPAEFKPFVADQVRKIGEITRSAGIEPQ